MRPRSFLADMECKKKIKFNLSIFFFCRFHCEWSALTSSRRVSIFCMSLDAEHLRYLPCQRSHSFLLSGESWTKCLIRAFAVQTAQSALCVTAIINAFQVERIRQKSVWLCLKNANWWWGGGAVRVKKKPQTSVLMFNILYFLPTTLVNPNWKRDYCIILIFCSDTFLHRGQE